MYKNRMKKVDSPTGKGLEEVKNRKNKGGFFSELNCPTKLYLLTFRTACSGQVPLPTVE